MLTLLLALTTALADDLVVTEVAFGTGFGAMPLPVGRLNDALDAAGHPAIGPAMITPLAVNGELWIGRVVPGFDYITWSDVGGGRPGDTDTKFALSLTELSFGYGVIYKPRFNLQPRIGFGLMDVDLSVNRTGKASFVDGVENPNRSFVAQRQSMVADIGLGVGWLVHLTKPDVVGVGTSLRIAIRAGGLAQLFQTSRWKADGEALSDMPGFYLGGPYVRLMISPSLVVRHPKGGRAPVVVEEAPPLPPVFVTPPEPVPAEPAPTEPAPVEATAPIEAAPEPPAP